MKYILLFIANILAVSTVIAQNQQVIVMNSGSTDVHLRLEETQENDFARMEFYTEPTSAQLDSGQWGSWVIAGRSVGATTDVDNQLSFWHVDGPTNGGTPLLAIQANGDATLMGTLTQLSDRSRKENITAISHAEILDKVAGLAISQWNYIDQNVSHIGPMAQDFYAAFGLGNTNKGIAAIDSDGIALAAIQALKAENDALKLQLAKLAARIDGIMK